MQECTCQQRPDCRRLHVSVLVPHKLAQGLSSAAAQGGDVGAWASATPDLPFDGRALSVISRAVDLGVLPPMDADPVLDLQEMSPNLAQAMLQARLCSLSAMYAATGCA